MTSWLLLAIRAALGVLWVWAGAVKITDPYGAVLAVRAYQLLPGDVAEVVGHLLPSLEIVVGVALLLGVLTRASAAVSAVLFGAFVIGIASVWQRGILIDCGCFGGGGFDPDAADKYPWEIARDVVLLAASLLLAWRGGGRWSLDARLFRRTPEPDPQPDPQPDPHADQGALA